MRHQPAQPREILGSTSHPMRTGGPSPAQQDHMWRWAHHVAGGERDSSWGRRFLFSDNQRVGGAAPAVQRGGEVRGGILGHPSCPHSNLPP